MAKVFEHASFDSRFIPAKTTKQTATLHVICNRPAERQWLIVLPETVEETTEGMEEMVEESIETAVPEAGPDGELP